MTKNLEEALDRIKELSGLYSGWFDENGVDGESITQQAVLSARLIVLGLDDMGHELPAIFPRLDGGISLEWLDKPNIRIEADGTYNAEGWVHTR